MYDPDDRDDLPHLPNAIDRAIDAMAPTNADQRAQMRGIARLVASIDFSGIDGISSAIDAIGHAVRYTTHRITGGTDDNMPNAPTYRDI